MSKFVDALEACVREAAARVAATSHVWHDHCVSPGEKTRVQVEQLAPLMDEMRVEWGYRVRQGTGDGGGGGVRRHAKVAQPVQGRLRPLRYRGALHRRRRGEGARVGVGRRVRLPGAELLRVRQGTDVGGDRRALRR